MTSLEVPASTASLTAPPHPIVVDLDGTLILTDLLQESATQYLAHHPLGLFQLLAWLLPGRPNLKAQLATRCPLDPASLPYNQPLLDWLQAQKAQGRRLVLATASHRRQAEAVATHLGLFDEVLATEGTVNLKSARKRDALNARFGEKGYEYVGNEIADHAVWACASRAHVVSSSPRFIEAVRRQLAPGEVFAAGGRGFTASVRRAMRPYQWVKNVLIFVPVLAAHRYADATALLQALAAFIAFSLTASSVYLLNDLVDVADDRHHPRKRNRPFAAGDLSLLQGWLLWPALLALAIGLACALLPSSFVALLGGYFLLTLAYSFRLKRLAMLDVLSLALLLTSRIVAGASAVGVSLSFWLLAFSMFIFVSLAFMKRFSEIKVAREAGRAGPLRGRGYMKEDLELVSSLGTSAGYVSVMVLALYIQDSRTAALYPQPQFIWAACPLLLFWLSRAWLIAHRGQMHDDPIIFALKDRTSWLIGAGVLAAFALASLP